MKKRLKKLAAIGGAVSLLTVSALSYAPSNAKALTANEKLDNHVIFQSFSLYQPYESNMYNVLSSKGEELKGLGITDIWLPPAYRSFDMARYMEGYAIADRYDLGEFNQGPNNTQATKYGTSDELKNMINTLHDDGLKLQLDLVPNQMLGLPEREAVYVTRTDSNGNLFRNPFTTGKYTGIRGDLYLGYTKGGGQGQAKYGYIKQWNKNYFNGTSLQGLGMGRVMTDLNGKAYRYLGPNNSENYIPSWLNEAANAGKINTVDGYLSVDGWYAAKDATTSDNYWKPMLINYEKDTNYLTYMKENGYESVEAIINGDNGDIATKTDAYLKSQAAYGYGSEDKSYQNYHDGIDTGDQFLFVNENGTSLHTINRTMGSNGEFLVGMDIDNSNPKVQKEQINWMNWLLDNYKFDGFRIDAASHYDKQILLDEMDVKRDHFGSDNDSNLSYIESYSSIQNSFENNNGNGQLAMDYGLYYAFQDVLSKGGSSKPLTNLATNSVVNRSSSKNSTATPNWSFVNNHDQEKNRINKIILGLTGIKEGQVYEKGQEKSLDSVYTKELEKQAIDIYEEDMKQADKKYAAENVISQYAYLLTNKNTVPTVYYGDLYDTNSSYMTDETIYYSAITNLLKARKAYAYGDQKTTYYTSNTSSKTAGKDLLASVRLGNDRTTGLATVISNSSKINTTIKVDMGKVHANQVFKDATGFSKQKLVTDSKGILTVQVKGTQNAQVNGYLGVWVPTKDKVPTVGWEKVQSDVYQGKTVKVKPQLKNTTAAIASVTYSSSNTSVATVDKSGNVKGSKKTGTADINATITTKDNYVLYSTAKVKVNGNTVTLKKNSTTLKLGKKETISVKTSSDKIKSVSYKSSNTKIATVSSKGQVTAKKTGKTTITATYKTQAGYTVTKKFTVTVKK